MYEAAALAITNTGKVSSSGRYWYYHCHGTRIPVHPPNDSHSPQFSFPINRAICSGVCSTGLINTFRTVHIITCPTLAAVLPKRNVDEPTTTKSTSITFVVSRTITLMTTTTAPKAAAREDHAAKNDGATSATNSDLSANDDDDHGCHQRHNDDGGCNEFKFQTTGTAAPPV